MDNKDIYEKSSTENEETVSRSVFGNILSDLRPFLMLSEWNTAAFSFTY